MLRPLSFSAIRPRFPILHTRSIALHAPPKSQQRLPYFVPRNSRGSLPVYSDIRNGGTRYLISVRNVEGDTKALADDLASGLFGPGSPEAQRVKVQIIRSKHLVLSGGGRWKHNVVEWLTAKGF